ncbi:uncharacterized protein [Spinacia oleracea]|uniref:Uncharacterized protein isoform X2 n=1 Tax=Spinacia oleracea TaxID=3562 RepID=A0ABM3RUM6_SPIOL|nr:uncharacterized protein LOC130472430 isoform X2 [Spinacia oleracea]
MDKEKIEVTSAEQSSKGERIKKMKRGREDDQGSDGEELNPVIPAQLHQSIRRRSSWKIPPPNRWKVNTYGGASSYGYCIRGSYCELVACGVKWMPLEEVVGWSKELMEAEASYYGLQKALEFGYRNVIAECSCLPFLTKIKERVMRQDDLGIAEVVTEDLRIPEVVTKILQLRSRFDALTVSCVKPDGNSVAYEMSKLTVDGWKTGRELYWLINFPKVASDAASWDVRCSLDNQWESLEKEITHVELQAPTMSSRTGEASSPDENTAESKKNPGAASIASPDSDTIP